MSDKCVSLLEVCRLAEEGKAMEDMLEQGGSPLFDPCGPHAAAAVMPAGIFC